jgi:hypothetical protein
MAETLYLLLHHHHLPTAEDPAVPDLFEDGEPLYWDDNEDSVKVLGLYTTPALAEARIEHFRELPGFRETPGGFAVHPYELDQPLWLRGFRHSGP